MFADDTLIYMIKENNVEIEKKMDY